MAQARCRPASGGRGCGQRKNACVLWKLVTRGESRSCHKHGTDESRRKVLVTPKIFLQLRFVLIINAGFCLLHSDSPLYFHVHYGISLWKVLAQCRRWSFATANHQVLLPKMVGFCCCSYSLEQHFYEAKIAPKFGCLQTFFSALFLVEGQWMNVFIGVISASLWIQMRYTDTRGTW